MTALESLPTQTDQSEKERLLERNIDLSQKIERTRLAKELLSLIVDPSVVYLMPGVAEHLQDLDDETKDAIFEELVADNALEYVDGSWKATPEGLKINRMLITATERYNQHD